MTAPAYTAADFARVMQAQLPRGRVWPREPDAVQSKVIAGLAPSYQRNSADAAQLVVDAFPGTTLNLLPEWEESLGLPDPCAGPAPTIPQRQGQVIARLTDTGSPTPQYYVNFAGAMGFTITITQFRPMRFGDPFGSLMYGAAWAFAWQVNASASLTSAQRAVLECEFKARLQAHTTVLFSYT